MAGKNDGVGANPKQIKTDVDCRAARPKFDDGAWSPAKISDVTGGGLYLFVTPDQSAPITNGPAKAAIIPPTPTHTSSAMFMFMSDQAIVMQRSMTSTVDQRLITST